MKNNTTKPFYNTSIPSDWTVKKLSQIANVKTGPFGAQLHESDYVRVGNPIITVEHLSEHGIVHSNLPLVSSKDKERLSQYILLENDIVFSRVGSVDRNSLVTDLEHGWLFSGRLLRVRINNGNNSLFVSQYFNSDSFKQLIRSIAVGQTMPSLNTEILSGVQIPLPPLPEQQAIAHVLGLMDLVINKNNQLIAQKELRKRWLTQNLLTGKKRLKGFDGEWKKVGAGEIFKSITVKECEDEELLSATQDRGIIPRTMLDGRVTMPDGTTAGYKLVEPGDFVISLRSFQGGLEYSYYRGIVSPAYIVLKPRKKINDEFYKHYYKSYEFIGRLATAVIGIRDGKQISYDDFCFVRIPYPSYKEQTAIAQVLQAADKEIQLLKAKTDKLREQKKGMMQVLLTGKVRIKNLNL
ncbi:MAG: restriction endonuclease subunit S [Mangrovibacterium sp.]